MRRNKGPGQLRARLGSVFGKHPVEMVIVVALAASVAIVVGAGGPTERVIPGGTEGAFGAPPGSVALPTMEVFKSAACSCCGAWVEHVEEAGFPTIVTDTHAMLEVKRREGIPRDLESCHTALVGGYVIEGHVPADLIERLLRERPEIAGLAAPGMPVGSPGMEGPNAQPYDVIAFTADGQRTVYATR